MKYKKENQWQKILSSLFFQIENAKIIPSIFLQFLVIQKSLLEFSFIFEDQQYHSYNKFFVIIARPQTVIQIKGLEFLFIIQTFLFILGIYIQYPGRKYIYASIILFRSALLQFFFESFDYEYIQHIVRLIIIIQMLLQLTTIQGTLNVKAKNLSQIQVSILDFVLFMLDISILIIRCYFKITLIIVIFSIINCLFKIFNQLIYKPYQTQFLTTISITIYIVSCIKGFLILLFQYQIDFDILLFPFVVACVLQFIKRLENYSRIKRKFDISNNINDSTKNLNQYEKAIVIASQYIQIDQQFDALYQLHQIPLDQLSIFTQYKLKYLIMISSQKICSKILQQNDQQQSFGRLINFFINVEYHFQEIEKEVTNIIQMKILCLNKMKEFDQSQIDLFINTSKLIQEIKQKFQQKFQEYPTQKIQSILGFYFVQIMNDYIAATSLFGIDSFKDEQINKLKFNVQLLSRNVSFVIFKFEKELIVTNCSQNFQELVKLKQDEITHQPITSFLPDGIKQIHNKKVKNFIDGQKCRFFQNFDNTIIFSSSTQTYKQIEMCIDLSFTDEIFFISLFQQAHDLQYSLIINSEQIIISMSDSLIQYLSIESFYQRYYNHNIKKLISNFSLPKEQGELFQNQELVVSQQSTSLRISSKDNTYIISYQLYFGDNQEDCSFFIIIIDSFQRENSFDQESSLSSFKDTFSFSKQEEIINEGNSPNQPYFMHLSAKLGLKESQMNSNDQIYEQNHNLISSPRSQVTLTQNFLPNQRKRSIQNEQFFEQQQIIVEKARSETEDNLGLQVENHATSQLSSLTGCRNSKFFKKYDLVSKIGINAQKIHYHKILIIAVILFMITQIVLQSITLYLSQKNVEKSNQDIDLLQITNFLFAPLEDQVLLKTQLINYYLLQKAGSITQLQLLNYIQYPNKFINSLYYKMKQNVDQMLNRELLQSFLENNYIIVQQQIATNSSDKYNISLRQSFNVLLNFQYDSITFVNSILSTTASVDTPFTYYTIKNLIPIKQQFQALEEFVEISTLNMNQQYKNQSVILLIVQIILLILELCLMFQIYIKILKKQRQYLKLVFYASSNILDVEIIKYQKLLSEIKNNNNILYYFEFNLDRKDKQLDLKQRTYHSFYHLDKTISIQQLFSYKWLILLFIIIFIIILNILVTYYILQEYFQKYPDTIKLFRKISVLGVDLPTLYSRRETYQDRAMYPFFSPSDGQLIITEMLSVLSRIQSFSENNDKMNNLLISESFQQQYDEIMQSNLCEYLPDSIKNESEQLCPKVLNGWMYLGVQQILISIINQFQTDYAVNQFKTKLESPILELEGIFMINEILLNVNESFKNQLPEIINTIILSLQISNICLLLIQSLLFLTSLWIIIKVLIKQNYAIQSLPYILPELTMLIDDTFERQIKTLILGT